MVQDGIILSNVLLTEDTYRMEIACDSSHAKPGQFVQVEVPGYFLRRPISICEITSHGLVLVYKVVGQGTQKMAEMKEGNINLFGPLGTGFPVEAKEHVVLMGGGVGVPPLYETAKQYLHQGTKVDVVLGFNTKNQAIYLEEFEALGARVTVASMDGSIGKRNSYRCDARKGNSGGFHFSLWAITNVKSDSEYLYKGIYFPGSTNGLWYGCLYGLCCKRSRRSFFTCL